jgi:hypothetical protein
MVKPRWKDGLSVDCCLAVQKLSARGLAQAATSIVFPACALACIAELLRSYLAPGGFEQATTLVETLRVMVS